MFLFSFANSFGQNNTINGLVLAEEDNSPMAGALVMMEGTNYGTRTNMDGKFSLEKVANGSYVLIVKYLSYNDIRLTVECDGTPKQTLTILMVSQKKAINEVKVSGKKEKSSTVSLISMQSKSATLVSSIGADLIKQTPDRTVSDVLKRSSGMSVVGGKYAVVRGMEGRYVSTMLNGILIPSTEPDKKAFSFDLLPANLIDNITITKAALPEYTGEFAGGIIDVNLKDIVQNNFCNISLGIGSNSQTISQPFYTYQGGKTDFIGLDDGTRTLPNTFPTVHDFGSFKNGDGKSIEAAKTLSNIWTINKSSAMPNISGQLSTGINKKVFGRELGIVTSFTYSKNNNTQNQITRFTSPDSSEVNNYKDKIYSQTIMAGALVNASYRINANNKIYFKNIYSISSVDRAMQREGERFGSISAYINSHELFFNQNTLLNSQLGAYHFLPKSDIKIRWNLNYSKVAQELPDRRILEYRKANAEESDDNLVAIVQTVANPQYGGRFFSTLNENAKSAKLDLEKELKLFEQKQIIKVGAYYQTRDRNFAARNLGMTISNIASFDFNLKKQQAENIFSEANLAKNGFTLSDASNPSDAYIADANLKAAYLQFDNRLGNKIKISWGTRVEAFEQNLYSKNPQLDTVIVNNINTDFLPSAVLTYAANDKTNLRFCISNTVSRPEFREIAPLNFFDFVNNAYWTGNQNLKRNKVLNSDIRYEYYPKAGELFTVGVFYKSFKDAIQPYVNVLGGGFLQFSYSNAPKAYNSGIEFEFRKKLDVFAGKLKFLENITTFGNLTLINSKVLISNQTENDAISKPLVNQSPMLINAGISYAHPKNGTSLSMLLYRYGRRLNSVGESASGTFAYQDIWEAPRAILDLQIAKKIKERHEIKLNYGDILNQNNTFYQDMNHDKKFKESDDRIVFQKRLGTNFSVKYAFNF